MRRATRLRNFCSGARGEYDVAVVDISRALPSFRGPQRIRCSAIALAAAAALPFVGVGAVHAQDPGDYGRLSVAPAPRDSGESAPYVVRGRGAALRRNAIGIPQQTAPIVQLDDFGARGDGVTDDGEAIALALQALDGGGTLVFSPNKTYLKSDLVRVDRPGVKLWGYGAVLYSVVTDRELEEQGAARVALHLDAPETAVYGLTLVSNMRTRVDAHPNLSGIWLSSSDQEAIDNRLEYVNIFVREATRFSIARNVVYRSTFDGIHVTTDSSFGKIVGNVVRQTGDDMIAVVSYGLGEPNVGPVLIEDNDVSDQYWGRGIAVVGGHDVEIRNNRISRTPFGAGILIHSETSYESSNVRNVLVQSNQISDVQTLVPSYNPAGNWNRAGHGAIDVYGQGGQEVSGVTISGNTIEQADRDAILVRGLACGIDITDNRAEGVGRDAIRIETDPESACTIRCLDNSVSDLAPLDPRCAP
jgi:hypothetical protein